MIQSTNEMKQGREISEKNIVGVTQLESVMCGGWGRKNLPCNISLHTILDYLQE